VVERQEAKRRGKRERRRKGYRMHELEVRAGEMKEQAQERALMHGEEELVRTQVRKEETRKDNAKSKEQAERQRELQDLTKMQARWAAEEHAARKKARHEEDATETEQKETKIRAFQLQKEALLPVGGSSKSTRSSNSDHPKKGAGSAVLRSDFQLGEGVVALIGGEGPYLGLVTRVYDDLHFDVLFYDGEFACHVKEVFVPAKDVTQTMEWNAIILAALRIKSRQAKPATQATIEYFAEYELDSTLRPESLNTLSKLLRGNGKPRWGWERTMAYTSSKVKTRRRGRRRRGRIPPSLPPSLPPSPLPPPSLPLSLSRRASPQGTNGQAPKAPN
jgi:hypothetical protein